MILKEGLSGNFWKSDYVSCLMSKANGIKYNWSEYLGRNGQKFVAPSNEIDQLLKDARIKHIPEGVCDARGKSYADTANGYLEYKLSLNSGDLGDGEIIRQDIPVDTFESLRAPEKGDYGANLGFVEREPGGVARTGGHVSEALGINGSGEDVSVTIMNAEEGKETDPWLSNELTLGAGEEVPGYEDDCSKWNHSDRWDHYSDGDLEEDFEYFYNYSGTVEDSEIPTEETIESETTTTTDAEETEDENYITSTEKTTITQNITESNDNGMEM